MRFRKQAFHDTAVMQAHAGVQAEELADFREGDHVMTVDGFPGKVTAVLFGPYQGTESYQVELDGGMGGGDYSPGQLRPHHGNTASREVQAIDYTASIPVEATTEHLAHDDYPELEDILIKRQPIERIRHMAAVNKDDEASQPDSSQDDPGENLNDDKDVEEPDLKGEEDPNADPEDKTEEGSGGFKVGDVTPPSACSNCGGTSFGDAKNTGRGVRMSCQNCNATMTSWGGQWQPEFPNSPANHASGEADYRSGGVGGIGNAPGAKPGDPLPEAADPNAASKAKPGDDAASDTKTIELKLSSITASMSNAQVAESLQSEAGIVQYLFTKVYEKARRKYEQSQIQWWMPPTDELGTDLQGPPQYTASSHQDSPVDQDWHWHFTASWMDVQEKARRLRKKSHVKIVSASKTFVAAEVLGDTSTYETQLNYVPGTRKVADWACGCKWGAYTWGRSARFRRFEGRLCSHALATQYEANARGIFGRDVQPDSVRPDWQKSHSPVVVQYDRSGDKNLTRRAVPPANMKRTFSSLILDSDGIYPEPQALDLSHPPVYATVQNMVDNNVSIVDTIDVLASYRVPTADARAMVFDALLGLSTDAGYSVPTDESESGSESLSATAMGQAGPGYQGLKFSYWKNYSAKSDAPHWLDGHDKHDSRSFFGMMAHHPDHQQAVGSLEFSPLHYGEGDQEVHVHGVKVPEEHQRRGVAKAMAAELLRHYPDTPINHGIKTDMGEGLNKHLTGEDSGLDANPGKSQSYGDAPHATTWSRGGKPFDPKQADYSSGDPFVGFTDQRTPVSVPHSNSENPASTGWATSQDPGDWGRSLISNNFGITTDSSLKITGAATQPPSVSGVALKAADSGRVLMIQRSHHDEKDPARGTWEFPGGHHEEGDQTSLHAGIREWEEETGQPFPQGGHLTHVHRSGPYALHTVVIPEEKHVDFSKGRSESNPDGPDGDSHEQAPWWQTDHAKKNPALRQELKSSSPFEDIKKAADLSSDGYESEAAMDFQSRLLEDPEGALPFTEGESEPEEVRPDAPAGATREKEQEMSSIASAKTEAEIIEAFQQTAGGQKLAKQAMKDFSYAEQQELINEGKGDRARNFTDLKIAGTHYELIGEDNPDDETILWV